MTWHRFVIGVLLVACIGCAEPTARATATIESSDPVAEQPCTFDAGSVAAARVALAGLQKKGSVEPLAVLSSALVDERFRAVVMRPSGQILAVGEVYDADDKAVALMVSAGDVIAADLVFSDAGLKKLSLTTKAAFVVSKECR